MNPKLRPFFLFFVILLFVGIACNLPIIGDKLSGAGDKSDSTPSSDLFAQATEINPKPIGIQEGLGSLDSYSITASLNMTDSDGSDTELYETLDRDIANSKSHTVTTNISREAGESEDSTSTEEVISSGLVTCTKNDEGWDYSAMTEQEKEMSDIFKQMIDVLPLIDDPIYVNDEEINGVQTHHFTFEVNGIGQKSGSVATTNHGEYWIAIDGQYMVKYQLELVVQSAANDSGEQEVASISASFDLSNINQPLEIELPSDCVPSE
jgi:hypothetical protein